MPFDPCWPRVTGARSPAVTSLDRIAVSADGALLCPLRDAGVTVAVCLVCQRLERTGGGSPPTYIVCDAREVVGWLGLDSPL